MEPKSILGSNISFDRAKSKDRKSLIYGQRPQRRKHDDKVRLIFTYNASNPPVHQWVREARKVLDRNDRATQELTKDGDRC